MDIERESKWVRVFRTSQGVFIDSKYRTREYTASADVLLDDWRSASEQEKLDIEVAFRFFPHVDEVARVIAAISRDDPSAASRMRATWFTPESLLNARELSHLLELQDWLRSGDAPERISKRVLVAESFWFRAYEDAAGIEFEYKVSLEEGIDMRLFRESMENAKSDKGRLCYELFLGFYRAAAEKADDSPRSGGA